VEFLILSGPPSRLFSLFRAEDALEKPADALEESWLLLRRGLRGSGLCIGARRWRSSCRWGLVIGALVHQRRNRRRRHLGIGSGAAAGAGIGARPSLCATGNSFPLA